MLKEFSKFIKRGSVIDLAVGVIIGGAFSNIVSSLVEDIIMPPLGLLLGKVDFSNLYINLGGETYPTLSAAREAGAATINYGVFINTVINFLIMAFVIFIIIRQVNKLENNSGEKTSEPTTRECPFCYSEINIKANRCPACTSMLLTRLYL
jgi:large conductance mechanosensitive channel